MSGLIYGYCCPKCDEVQDEDVCQKHPKMLMRLILDNPYTPAKTTDKGNWRLFDEDNNVLCTTTGSSEAHSSIAMRIGLTLAACSEISDAALSFGYIQTLQELAALVAKHLNNPTDASNQALVRQLALIELCGHAN